MRVITEAIGLGDVGTYQTVQRMRTLARGSIVDPLVRAFATAIVSGTGRNSYEQIDLLRSWVSEHLEFIRDPNGTELLQTPHFLLRKIRVDGQAPGDCDDVAMMAAALGMAVGLRARFVILGRTRFEHIFTELSDPAGSHWVELDTTRPRGVHMSSYPRVKVIEV